MTLICLQACANITAVVDGNVISTPYILISEDTEVAFLIVDKTVVCEIPILMDIPFVLMASYFVFNICYPKGCNNLCSFMEILTLNYPADKASATTKHFLTSLRNV